MSSDLEVIEPEEPAKKLSVLLVEDSVMDSRLLVESLRPHIASGELVIQTVKTLKAAIVEIGRFGFQCVLLDLGLPDGRGVGNVQALRDVDPLAAIVILTGLNDERSATEALKLGAQDYVIKGSVDGAALLTVIRRAVQRNGQTVVLETRKANSFFDASRDAATGLPNRALFSDRARQQIAEAKVRGSAFGLAYLALGGLKEAHREYGQSIADELLAVICKQIGDLLRPSDTLARVDSSGLAILWLPFTDYAEIAQSITEIQQIIAGIRHVGNCAVHPTVKIGLAIRKADESVEELFRFAQAEVSRTGPALDSNSTTASGTPTLNTLTLVPARSNISATVNLDFELRWQPWMDVDTNRVECVQCLPRWRLDQGTFYAPQLSPADALGLVSAVADAIAQQIQAWRSNGIDPGLISFEIPGTCLLQKHSVLHLRELFFSYEILTNQVQIELPESAFKNVGMYQAALSSLHAAGFNLCLNGDGSRDISLSDLVRVPLSYIRLSGSFVSVMLEESLQGASRRLINALVAAAKSFGTKVVATEVNSSESLSALRLIGLHLAQGEALVSAISSEEILPLLRITRKNVGN